MNSRMLPDDNIPLHNRVSRQRNICMLAYTFYESDFRVMRYAEALAQNGHHVDVIALRNPGDRFYEIINDVHVYRIQDRLINERGKFSYLFRILKFQLKSAVFFTRQLGKIRYDLVHVHNVPDFLVFAAVVPKIYGSKLILDIHDILPEFYASKFNHGKKGLMFKVMTIVEKLSTKFSDHVIISNHLWKEKIESRSIKPDKCTAIINYPDQEIFFKRSRKEQKHEIVMLYPGTVNWHQGLDIAVNAFNLIKDKAPSLDFHIYGSGTHVGQVERLIDRLEMKNRVFLYPQKSLREIAEIIAKADFGVIPKRNDQFGGEAFSTKSLEFMSCGVPIIISKTKIDNYYFDDSLVKFFESENVDDLAEAMLLMAQDVELRNRLSKQGVEFSRNNSWNIKKQTYLNLVNGLRE